MKQLALPVQGQTCGPLFAPIVKVRPNPRLRMSGGAEVWIKCRRARPPWASRSDLRTFWRWSRIMTKFHRKQYSVDHIVPLIHPLVCGLHCPANLRVIPLSDAIAKSNNVWPDMPEYQLELL